jgi:hypothetical protein
MATFTVPKDMIAKGPGTLFYSDPGAAEPDPTVAGNVFSVNTWTGWSQWGITASGSEWTIDVSSDPIQAAEYLDDLDQVMTGRVVSVKFELMRITAALAVRFLNRPTPSTTGSGATKRTRVKMPSLGAELPSQVGWQATDDQERIVGLNALQIGSLVLPRRKGADVAKLPVEFKLLPDTNGEPFLWDFAGPRA